MSDAEKCPLEPVERRLEDCHRQWHEAGDAYFDPDHFRVRIQTCIQSLRTVTFILQKIKGRVPDFERWYPGWQERLRADPLMAWMVDARNRIEKQGDLEIHSVIRAGIVASYLEQGPEIVVPAKLFQGPSELIESIPENKLGGHLRENGVLRIRRRWVENSLPDYELLDAVAIAYGRISEIIDDAHGQLGDRHRGVVNTTTGEMFAPGARGGRLPCMIGHEVERTLLLRLKDGARLTFAEKQVPITAEDEEKVAKRFPVAPDEIFPGPGATAEETVRSLFSAARKVFQADAHHVTIMFILRQARPIRIIELRPEDQAEKYMLMRRMADEVVKTAADAVILLGEIWSAPFDAENPYRRAADAPERTEHLTGTLVQKDGAPLQLMAQIIRKEDKVTLDPTQEITDPFLWAYAPIYAAWNKPLPEHWRDPAVENDR